MKKLKGFATTQDISDGARRDEKWATHSRRLSGFVSNAAFWHFSEARKNNEYQIVYGRWPY